ncbi:MAG TPA: amidohydrolase family protein [Myxococcota bacterium]|nr:amidohydrolase family protein [Myxococcota bacterium]
MRRSRASTLTALVFMVACGSRLELERDPVGVATDIDADTTTDIDVATDATTDILLPDAETPSLGGTLLVGATLIGASPEVDGQVASVLIRDGKIVALGAIAEDIADNAMRVDMGGRFLTPAFIDSHVHVIYWEVADRLPAGGLAAVVDHAAPEDRFFDRDFGALRVLGSGPMITAPFGYPTTSWGSDGYGRECDPPDECAAAVDALFARGAGLVKLSFGAGPDLSQASLEAVFAAANELGLPVSAHALQDNGARRAAELGADVLAHVPVQQLSEATIALWSDRAVVATLDAFGGSDATIDNLRRLREAGALVLYGTDLGNSRTAGIDLGEITLMHESGMDGAEILASATRDPAAFWGFEELGVIAVDKAASLLVLEDDPRLFPETLARPVAVWIDGEALAVNP